MKKYLITGGIAAMAFIAIASAQSFAFNNNISVGASGSDVINLQNFLIANGFHIPSIESGAAVRGYFGSQTRAAVAAYQAANGIPNTGYVGPLTRGKLNGGSNNSASLRVTSPNGGETWKTGSTQVITWTGAPGILNQTGSIYLEYPLPACADPAINPVIRCMIAVRAPQLIANSVNLSTGQYSWLVGKALINCDPTVSCFTSDGGVVIADGQYKIHICPNNSNACDSSDSNFTISSIVSANAPVINGIDAPTTLSVGQTGTWTVHAVDPLNASLSYSIDWGDNPTVVCPAGFSCAQVTSPATGAVSNTTFTHSYSTPGTYTVKFTVTNLSGASAQTSSSVTVTNGSAAGPLKIISPNGGETWLRNTTQTIKWTSPNYFAAAYADIRLNAYQAPCSSNQICPMYMIAPYTIASNVPINQNSYVWSVGNQAIPSCPNCGTPPPAREPIPDGQYTISICEVGSNNCATSSGPFTISSGTITPSVTVVSPNGGESWPANSTHQISWKTSSNQPVDIYLGRLLQLPCAMTMTSTYDPNYCRPQFQILYTLDKNIAANMVYNWIVATDMVNTPIPAGTYGLEVCTAGSTSNCDASDGQFTIN